MTTLGANMKYQPSNKVARADLVCAHGLRSQGFLPLGPPIWDRQYNDSSRNTTNFCSSHYNMGVCIDFWFWETEDFLGQPVAMWLCLASKSLCRLSWPQNCSAPCPCLLSARITGAGGHSQPFLDSVSVFNLDWTQIHSDWPPRCLHVSTERPPWESAVL